MTFKQIANKVNGLSCPIFGISWTPIKLEIDTAEKVITFLEDRRVLYSPYELEVPNNCISSINKIREFLTTQLFDLSRDSELAITLRSMRSACRKFLDSVQNEYYFNKATGNIDQQLGLGGQMHFYSAMGELRGTIGYLIAKVFIMHGLDCESGLLQILPIEMEE